MMATFVIGDLAAGINFDSLDLSSLLDGEYLQKTSTFVSIANGVVIDNFFGVGIQYNAQNIPESGTITRIQEVMSGHTIFDITNINVSVSDFMKWVLSNENELALQTIFAGADQIQGGNNGDTLSGFAGSDIVLGGAGDDLIVEFTGQNYLRGDTGNDRILGGTDFDDINGNAGNDTASGGAGNDWVVGGRDNDFLLGETGDDIVYGNLGNDSCDGGTGNDIVRGGQQNDVLNGGDGADWMSGDRDNDTITGGGGADIFHTFGDAGIDRVTDFNRAEGDRVQLDPGTTYSVVQSGADTVINMSGGGQMILVGVSISSLSGDWIFGA